MLDNLTLDQMRTFVVVVESGSFRAGAARLSRVQSAISHAIGNLEAELRVRFPSLCVVLRTKPMRAALHAVVHRNCGLAITTDTFRDTFVEAQLLGAIPPFVAVCSATHPLAMAPAGGWSSVELSDHVQIVVTDPSPMTEGQDFGVLSPGTWRVSDLATKLALIAAGTGWGNLPLWLVEEDLRRGKLTRVAAAALGVNAETALNAYLLWRIDEPLRPAACHLRERLLSRFGGDHAAALRS